MRITDKLRYGSALPLSNAHVVTNGSRLCFRLGMRLISQKLQPIGGDEQNQRQGLKDVGSCRYFRSAIFIPL